jgi:hypothetical protein
MTKLESTKFITNQNNLTSKEAVVDPSDSDIHSVVQGDKQKQPTGLSQ